MSLALAQRLRAARLLRDWSRASLAERAGVSLASLRRFETQAKASLDLVLRVAHALGRLDEFDALLLPPVAQSMEELEARSLRPQRKRGRQ